MDRLRRRSYTGVEDHSGPSSQEHVSATEPESNEQNQSRDIEHVQTVVEARSRSHGLFIPRDRPPPISPPPPPLAPHSVSRSPWDDYVLAVDDPRRSFDFAGFLADWQGSDLGAIQPIQVDPVAGFPVQYNESLNTIRRQDLVRGGADIQGLDWRMLGSDRNTALRARKLLRPAEDLTGGPAPELDVENDNPDAYYSFRAFTPRHVAQYSHYQLRNMVATHGRSDVFFGRGTNVTQTSMASPTSQRTIMDLSKPCNTASAFKVTCVASSVRSDQDSRVLIAGGFNGEFAMVSLDASSGSKPHEGTVSYARDGIVNHIRTFKDRISGLDRAVFSSNDCKVRVMDLQQARFVDTFEYESPLNCSASSPDGRLRALVYDGPETLITNAEKGDILFRLSVHSEYAFACDWSPCGRYVATGAEDCRAVVWDARNWRRPLQKLQCVMSCARSVHFTDDGALVIAENEDVVSIVETKAFDLRQDIRFFGSIAGVSVLNGGEEIVVANADRTVGGLLSFQRVSQGWGRVKRRFCGAREHPSDVLVGDWDGLVV